MIPGAPGPEGVPESVKAAPIGGCTTKGRTGALAGVGIGGLRIEGTWRVRCSSVRSIGFAKRIKGIYLGLCVGLTVKRSAAMFGANDDMPALSAWAWHTWLRHGT